MNRHYNGVRLREVMEKLRNVKRDDGINLNIWADLIVGFPGETDADFADTLEIVEKYGITQLHAFPFSAHVDHYSVPAGAFPDQVPNHIAQKRLKTLLKTGEEAFEKYARGFTGRELRVLIEKVGENTFSWWTENYLACDETNFTPLPWQEIARGKVVRGIYRQALVKDLREE